MRAAAAPTLDVADALRFQLAAARRADYASHLERLG